MSKNEVIKVEPEVLPKKAFKGYTIEELRYQKAITSLRKEFCKANVARSVDKLVHPRGSNAAKALPLIAKTAALLPSGRSSKGKAAVTTGKMLVKGIIGGLKPVDYIFLASSLVLPTVKMVRKIRNRRKQKKLQNSNEA